MNWSLAVALCLGSLIGLALGLLGTGGSIITLPLLVYLAGVPVSQAVPISLVVVGSASLTGSFLQSRRGSFDLKVALLFALAGMAGAFTGAQFTHLLAPELLMLLFACVMAGAGLLMLRPTAEIQPPNRRQLGRLSLAGAAVGAFTGFFGVGGGFLIVPALVLFGGLEVRRAVGTSLGVIALNCLAGLAGHLHQVPVNWTLTLAFVGTASVGMLAGVTCSHQVSEPMLKKLFAWFILVLAIVLGWRNARLLVHGA